ncbi:hypothetical protein [Cupriavidus pauculus]|uniref:hypothetical protein n=1 Tax=Cupriavidus pauculus TaxID=82633 RepID=UPI0011AFAA33|nr:hypothetical protein [Cupriavidus pauculus]
MKQVKLKPGLKPGGGTAWHGGRMVSRWRLGSGALLPLWPILGNFGNRPRGVNNFAVSNIATAHECVKRRMTNGCISRQNVALPARRAY